MHQKSEIVLITTPKNNNKIMAHNIEIRTIGGIEVPSFVESTEFGTQRSWHGLGERVEQKMTVVEALEKSHSNYEVTKQPIVALTDELISDIENGKFINASILKDLIVEGKMATFRTDYKETLGIVSPSYGIISNESAFSFVDDLCTGGTGKACIDCAGVLGKGERTFITARLDPIQLKGGHEDLIDMYLVFSNSFDSRSTMNCLITSVRTVCNNTLSLALKNNIARWNIRHTINCNNKIADVAEAARTLKLYDAYKAEFQETLDALSKVRLTEKEGEKMFAKAFMSAENWKTYVNSNYNLQSEDLSTRVKNQMTALINTAHTGVGQDWLEPYTGNWMLNAMTCYHENTAPNKDFDKQFDSLLSENGMANKRSQALYNQLMAKVA